MLAGLLALLLPVCPSSFGFQSGAPLWELLRTDTYAGFTSAYTFTHQVGGGFTIVTDARASAQGGPTVVTAEGVWYENDPWDWFTSCEQNELRPNSSLPRFGPCNTANACVPATEPGPGDSWPICTMSWRLHFCSDEKGVACTEQAVETLSDGKAQFKATESGTYFLRAWFACYPDEPKTYHPPAAYRNVKPKSVADPNQIF